MCALRRTAVIAWVRWLLALGEGFLVSESSSVGVFRGFGICWAIVPDTTDGVPPGSGDEYGATFPSVVVGL